MNHNTFRSIAALGISVFFVYILFAWQGDKGFNLWDEGFLWYGAQRILMGDVPIRDFLAYDPGRYYWSAALMSMAGNDGVMELRVAAALFQALGLFVGLLVISKATPIKNRDFLPYVFLSGAVLVAWMFPRHKYFDISSSIFLIAALTFWVEQPTPKRFFLAGVCLGLVAVVGRNHGMYGIAGSLGVMFWLYFKQAERVGFFKKVFYWGCGVVVGFAPILLMSVLIPGFAVAFWDSILLLFEQQATNLPLPVPWPWAVDYSALSFALKINGFLVGLFFMGLLGFASISLGWVLVQRFRERSVPSALVASAFLAFPYAHYAFSRADVPHLTQGVYPLLIACLVLLSMQSGRIKWGLSFLLLLGSVGAMFAVQPGWQCFERRCVGVEISESMIQVRPAVQKELTLLHQLVERYAPDGKNFIAAPFWPGAYAVFERESPMWEIYAFFPRSEAFQKTEIERIQAYDPAFVIILDFPLDGRDDLRFQHTHPLIYQYILDHFDASLASPDPMYKIFIARDVNP